MLMQRFVFSVQIVTCNQKIDLLRRSNNLKQANDLYYIANILEFTRCIYRFKAKTPERRDSTMIVVCASMCRFRKYSIEIHRRVGLSFESNSNDVLTAMIDL